MKILMSGANGLIGNALSKSLTRDGHEIVKLVRRERSVGAPEVEWHPNQELIDASQLEDFDVVVHLAGESIASGRWSDEKKKKIVESRVKGTTLLSRAISGLKKPPHLFISASAIGFYGNRGDELLTEESAPGNDFLANVCIKWEDSAKFAESAGIRTIKVRFGIILDTEGGALEKMLTPFRMGVGGKVGDGQQWMSWIALEDVVSGLRFLMEESSLTGPVNFVAPKPVRNAEFTKTLGSVLSRPTIFPLPAFAARLALGEMADGLLLSSAKVAPEKLQRAGFTFKYPDLRTALQSILTR